MAFGKKKTKEDEPAIEALDLDEPLDDATAALFAAPTPEAPAVEAELDEESAEAEPAAPPKALAGDLLLNMFQTTELEQDDLSMILSLAGDIEISDLLEDLQTLATAFGCNTDRDLYAA